MKKFIKQLLLGTIHLFLFYSIAVFCLLLLIPPYKGEGSEVNFAVIPLVLIFSSIVALSIIRLKFIEFIIPFLLFTLFVFIEKFAILIYYLILYSQTCV